MATSSTLALEQFMLSNPAWRRKVEMAQRVDDLRVQGPGIEVEDDSLFATDVTPRPDKKKHAKHVEDKKKDVSDASGQMKGKKEYVFDASGHIVIVTTKGDPITPEMQDLFNKAHVFLAAWTAALARNGKTLFDYEAASSVIRQSGYFSSLGVAECRVVGSETSVTLGGDIVMSVLDSIEEGDTAMKTAQRILGSLGGRIRASQSSSEETQTKAHLLLMCQNIRMVPIVGLAFYFVKQEHRQKLTDTDCSKAATKDDVFIFHKEDFSFSDPDYINKYASGFAPNAEYDSLIDRIAKPVTSAVPNVPGSEPPATK
ncbi:hypothetical protein A9R05_41960 (plasmid) [Burkholderia sp. KK1]|uniref:hypothetical protein n=1 Tax=Burkholderia sp. M701 TaxID=326454 RepID=UPI0009799E01|nr:hypothetical protein [Burkholderia sp. M701]AQH05591.1 hypothetical protein A9R05_41960 [Burkholderia sp. KK1]